MDIENEKRKLAEEKAKLEMEKELLLERQEVEQLKEDIKDQKRNNSKLGKWLKRINEKFGRY